MVSETGKRLIEGMTELRDRLKREAARHRFPFEARAAFDFDDDFALRDDQIAALVGRPHFSGAGCGLFGCGKRDHGWQCETLAEAIRIRDAVRTLPFITHAIVRETINAGAPA